MRFTRALRLSCSLMLFGCGVLLLGCQPPVPGDSGDGDGGPDTNTNGVSTNGMDPDRGTDDDCPDGEPCDDGDACTDNDTCSGDVCAGVPIEGCCAGDADCDDGNACTNDTCGADQRCAFTNNTAACGVNGTCASGTCVEAVLQDDLQNQMSDAISGDAINPAAPVVVGRVLRAVAPGSSGSGDAGDDCFCAWTVTPTTAVNLVTRNLCATDLTVAEEGNFELRVSVRCDDGNGSFAQSMSAVAAQGCDTPADCDDDNPCTDDTCTAEGICAYANNAASCDDGDTCTTDDACVAGLCTGTAISGCAACSTDVDCDDGDDCTTDACVNATCQFTTPDPAWHLVAGDIEKALLSVQVVANGDVYIVGADPDPLNNSDGGLIFRFDGNSWEQLGTDVNADFWWVHEVAPDDIWIGGSNRALLRVRPSDNTFELVDIGTGNETIYGIWSNAANDVWVVGGNAQLAGLLVRYDGTTYTVYDETGAGDDIATFLDRDPENLFKVWGSGPGNMFVLNGFPGLAYRYDGTSFSNTFLVNTLTTVHGTADGSAVTAVGGTASPNSGNLFDLTNGTWTDVTPASLPFINGVNYGSDGTTFAVGDDVTVLRKSNGNWAVENTGGVFASGLTNTQDFHAVWVDDNGNAWAVGGFLRGATQFTQGLIGYYGACPPGLEGLPGGSTSESRLRPLAHRAGAGRRALPEATDPQPLGAPTIRGATGCELGDCVGGPVSDAGLLPICLDRYDRDEDGDVDLADFAAIQRSGLGGSDALDLGGDWVFNRTVTDLGDSNPLVCVEPAAMMDITTVSVTHTASSVGFSFTFASDVDMNELIDESPGQAWFEFIEFICNPGEPFVVEMSGELIGDTVTAATVALPESCMTSDECPGDLECLGAGTCQRSYCFCGFTSTGSLAATVDECTGQLTGTMTLRLLRDCAQFPFAACEVNYTFTASMP